MDWKKRDAEYALVVRAAATRLMNYPGRPVQVTRSAIGRAVGAITLLRQKLHKMPLTAQVLTSVIETREKYAVRRIWRAAELYLQERTCASVWQLIRRANVYNLRKSLEVQQAIEAA